MDKRIDGLEDRLKEPVTNIHRIRAVMTCKDSSFGDYYNVPHVDIPMPHKTLIYYVNDSDGDTVIFKERWFGKNDYAAKTVAKTITPKPQNNLNNGPRRLLNQHPMAI
jgi:hypothetical protein